MADHHHCAIPTSTASPLTNFQSLNVPLMMNRSGSRESFLTDMSNVSVASLMSERSGISDLDSEDLSQQCDCMYSRFPYDELLKTVTVKPSRDSVNNRRDDSVTCAPKSGVTAKDDEELRKVTEQKRCNHELRSILLSPNLYKSFSSPELTEEFHCHEDHGQKLHSNAPRPVAPVVAVAVSAPLKRCLSDAVLLRRSSNVISQTKLRINPYRNLTPTQVTELKLLVVEALARTGQFPSSLDVASGFGRRTTVQEKSAMVVSWLKTMYDNLNDNLTSFTAHLKGK